MSNKWIKKKNEKIQCKEHNKLKTKCIQCTKNHINNLINDANYKIYMQETCGIPCIITSPILAKIVLKLLRNVKWHQTHSRILLNKKDMISSYRAYQIKDDETLHDKLMNKIIIKNQIDNLNELEKTEETLIDLLEQGEILYENLFQPQLYIVDSLKNDSMEWSISWLPLNDNKENIKDPFSLEYTKKKFIFTDLFAGIGGFHLALSELGGKCHLASEICPNARSIYASNFNTNKFIFAKNIKDIIELKKNQDIITAGFPCQPYLTCGTQKGLKDIRGQVFWHLLRLIDRSKPKAVFFENVTGLLNHHNGLSLTIILSSMTKIGYSVDFNIYNSNLFVPQTRERLFIICIRREFIEMNKSFNFGWPSGSYIDTNQEVTKHHKIKDILEENVDDTFIIGKEDWKSILTSNYYINNPESRVPSINGISNTIRATYKTGFKLYSQFVRINNNKEKEDEIYRFFTPRECARLQGFPDTFQIDSVPLNSQYHALGNAVTPSLVKYIAQSVLSSIFNE